MNKFIAFDIGASGGRAIIADVDAHGFHIREVARFANPIIRLRGHLYWDALRIYSEITAALGEIARHHAGRYLSMAIDTWAIDFGLLEKNGDLIGTPFCYRDPRTEGMMEAVTALVPRQEIFEQTGGIQFMSINTLYQLYAMAQAGSPRLQAAEALLLMPDLMNYWLTGVKATEYTNATTTQFFDTRTGRWARDLLERLGIPHHFLQPVIMPGTVLGDLLPEVQAEVGLSNLKVVATASHDTASAAAAVPAEGDDYAWLSSGTWSLLGATASAPIVTPDALRYNLSSFGGPDGAVLPWTNIVGLWLVQECRRVWARQGDELDYETISEIAAEARPFTAVLNSDAPDFLSPNDMPQAIVDYCTRTGQAAPRTKGEILRTALEGLALRYRWTIEKLEIVTGKKLNVLHIVGGGVQNRLLCQFAADATSRPVIAGPVEATAIGNIAVQAVAMGVFPSLAEARQVIRLSFDTVRYTPQPSAGWDAAYRTFLELISKP